jgi:hypothetical protein
MVFSGYHQYQLIPRENHWPDVGNWSTLSCKSWMKYTVTWVGVKLHNWYWWYLEKTTNIRSMVFSRHHQYQLWSLTPTHVTVYFIQLLQDKVDQLPTSGQWCWMKYTVTWVGVKLHNWYWWCLEKTIDLMLVTDQLYLVKVLISYQHQVNGFLWVSPISIVKFNSHSCYSVLHSTFTR